MQALAGVSSPGIVPGTIPGTPALYLNSADVLRQTVGGSDAALNNDPVGQWVARVGASPSQATAGKRLKVAISGGATYVAGTGDTNDGCLLIPTGSLTVTGGLTIYLSVVIPAGGNDGALIKLGGTHSDTFGFGIAGGGTLDGGSGFNIIGLREAVAWINTGLSVSAGVLTPIVVIIPTSGNITFRTPGGTYTSATWTMPTAIDFALSLGGYSVSGFDRFSSNAYIAEVAIYSSVLGSDDITALLARR